MVNAVLMMFWGGVGGRWGLDGVGKRDGGVDGWIDGNGEINDMHTTA